jgi:hypothetical protein
MYLKVTGLRRFGSNGKFYLEFSLSNKSHLFEKNKLEVNIYNKEFIKQNNELASVIRFFAGLLQTLFS